MRITVMGVLMVIGGILLLAIFVDHVQRNLNKNDEQNTPKVDTDEKPDHLT